MNVYNHFNQFEIMLTRNRTAKVQSKKTINKSTQSESETEQTISKIIYPKKTEPLQWSPQRLTVNYVPKQLVGRKEEAQQIYEFIQKCIMNKINSKVLYISGVPGSGKTASTIQILKQFKRQVKKVEFFYLNSLTLKKPDDIYKLIYSHLLASCQQDEKLKGTKSTDVQRLLAKIVKNHIIVIDEVDFLLTSDEKIFYNLFEWSYTTTTKLGFILISNTFDFPERLSTKINSRMGDHRMYFRPYSQEEIKDVIVDRLQNCPYFSSGAIVYASKKLAKYSSDIRVILNILHEAIMEHIDEKRPGKIEVKEISKLWCQKQEKQDPNQALSPLHLKIIEYVKKQGGQCVSKKLYEVLSQNKVTQGAMLALLKELEEMGLVKLKNTYFQHFSSHLIRLVNRE